MNRERFANYFITSLITSPLCALKYVGRCAAVWRLCGHNTFILKETNPIMVKWNIKCIFTDSVVYFLHNQHCHYLWLSGGSMFVNNLIWEQICQCKQISYILGHKFVRKSGFNLCNCVHCVHRTIHTHTHINQ